MFFFSNKRILIISPEPWDHIPVSKHHYARGLATLGNTVYFLNPPTHETSLRMDGGVMVVNYKTIRGVNRMPFFFRTRFNKVLIEKIEKRCGGAFDVVWTFDAFRFQNLQLFRAQLRIYHAVDIHIAPLENELASSADLILAVSELIRARFEKYEKPNAKINHGLADHFLQNLATGSREVNSKTNINVGYVGNLDNWCIDNETLLEIVESNRSAHFYFIGPYKADSPLAATLVKMPHCTLKGRVPTEKLPRMFQEMDMFLMCYKGAEKEVNSNHHKILEFISTGKPSVINYTDEYDKHRDLVAMADVNEEMPELFKKVISNLSDYCSTTLVNARRQFASDNSYASHIETIDQISYKVLTTSRDD